MVPPVLDGPVTVVVAVLVTVGAVTVAPVETVVVIDFVFDLVIVVVVAPLDELLSSFVISRAAITPATTRPTARAIHGPVPPPIGSGIGAATMGRPYWSRGRPY